MKGIPLHIASHFFLFICLILSSLQSYSQKLLSQLEIAHGAFNSCYELMVTDPLGNYYLGLEYGTDYSGVMVLDTLIKGFRDDPLNGELDLVDFYFLKFDSNHGLSNGFIIDNAEEVNDFYSSGEYNFVTMMLHPFEEDDDSLYPIVIGGELVIEREGNRGKSLLIVLNEMLELQKVLMPTTGE